MTQSVVLSHPIWQSSGDYNPFTYKHPAGVNPSLSMADEIEKAEAATAEPAAADPTSSSKTEDIDYKALADAEKARADAAEALIVKNKKLEKRHENEPAPLTREEVLELIAQTAQTNDQSPEAKALADAQKAVAELQAKNAELARAAIARASAGDNPASTQRDGLPTEHEPKLPANSPLKDYEYMGNGLYRKKLSSGKHMFRRHPAQPGLPTAWTE